MSSIFQMSHQQNSGQKSLTMFTYLLDVCLGLLSRIVVYAAGLVEGEAEIGGGQLNVIIHLHAVDLHF